MRIMLDTMVWSYVGDQKARRQLDACARSAGLTLVIPPSILLEVLRHPLPEKREPILDALLHGPHRRRLSSEADLESAEFIKEVERLRPGWIRPLPNTGDEATLRTYWTKRVWRSAEERPDLFSQAEPAQAVQRRAEWLVERQREQRQEVDKGRVNLADLSSLRVTQLPDLPADYTAGWDPTDAVEPWRVHNRDVYWQALAVSAPRSAITHEDTTYADWVGARVDLRGACADRADFTRLWLYEIDAVNVPRNWLRWAADMAQADMKIIKSNPYDAQHAAYLLDCDVFLTADTKFVRVLNRLRDNAPVPIAEARCVAPANIVEEIAAALDL